MINVKTIAVNYSIEMDHGCKEYGAFVLLHIDE